MYDMCVCALGWFNNRGRVKFLSLYNVHRTCRGLTIIIIREVYNKDTLCKRLPDYGHNTVVKCRTQTVKGQMRFLLCNCWIKCCIKSMLH